LAWYHFALAEHLVRRGDGAQAAPHVAEARARFARLGLDEMVARAVDLS
jgi:hypothetical protein